MHDDGLLETFALVDVFSNLWAVDVVVARRRSASGDDPETSWGARGVERLSLVCLRELEPLRVCQELVAGLVDHERGDCTSSAVVCDWDGLTADMPRAADICDFEDARESRFLGDEQARRSVVIYTELGSVKSG